MMRFNKVTAIIALAFLLYISLFIPSEVDARTTHHRIYGSNRFETAVEISKTGWTSSDTVILARSDDFPDALAGTPLAYHYNAPILLTPTASLNATTKAEIQRLNAKNVIILGGNAAVSQAVQVQLENMGLTTKRIGGSNRYDTAALIAAELPAFDTAVVAYGENYPDALAIGPYAARNGYPILLTRTNSIPDFTSSALVGVDKTIVVGGTGVISDSVKNHLPSADRIFGANRYETAAAIVDELYPTVEKAYVATGLNFADALTGSALAAKENAPIILVRSNQVPQAIKDLINKKNISNFVILGGHSVISNDVIPDLRAIEHIILRVVYVPVEWMEFTDITGWTSAAPIKEFQGVKIYDAAIWNDGLAVHLYALPNDYNPHYGEMEGLLPEARAAYRESYAVKAIPGMPAIKDDRGPFILSAFTDIAEELVERHPYASHNLIYSGHGIFGGELFELHLDHVEAKQFLSNWHISLGRKLGFIDMGTVCLKGSFYDLEAFYEHTDYYIATDQLAGCSTFNDDADYYDSDVDYNFPRILSSHDNMEDALIERVNLTRTRYENSSISIIQNQLMQSCYLYSSSKFGLYKNDISSFMKSLVLHDYVVDIRSSLVANGAAQSLINNYDSIIIHSVNTKDFFTWTEDWNGMIWLRDF